MLICCENLAGFNMIKRPRKIGLYYILVVSPIRSRPNVATNGFPPLIMPTVFLVKFPCQSVRDFVENRITHFIIGIQRGQRPTE